MKQYVKAIGASIGYTLVFYAVCWYWGCLGFDPSTDAWPFFVELALTAILLPLYFFVRNRVEKRWTFRGALLLSSVLLFCVTWAVVNGFADEVTRVSIFSYICFLESVYIWSLMLDLLGELLRLLARRLQNIRQPAWLIHAKVCLIHVNPNWKAFFAALLYLLFFYASPFIYEAFSGILDPYEYSFCFYIGLISLLYFFVRRHAERRWLFRGIVFLSRYCFIMLCVLFGRSEEVRNISMIAYFIIAAFLLLDLFAELLKEVYRLFRHIKRGIQNRHA